MSYHFPLPSPSPLLVSPREPASTGKCEHPQCDAELDDYAYRITLESKWVLKPTPASPNRMGWDDTTAIYCPECTREFIADAFKAAKDYQLDDWLNCIEKVKPCKDCGRFVCSCR